MTRPIFASMVLALSTLTATAQVRIHVSPPHYKKYEMIHASVKNAESLPVTFCIEVGQQSPKGVGELEATPMPFWVQRDSNGKWGTLLIGPDVGGFRGAIVLEAGESREFPFRLNDPGRMRLRLNYWRGSFPSVDCHAPPKGLRLVTSSVFTID